MVQEVIRDAPLLPVPTTRVSKVVSFADQDPETHLESTEPAEQPDVPTYTSPGTEVLAVIGKLFSYF
jgi:hypothetical protein